MLQRSFRNAPKKLGKHHQIDLKADYVDTGKEELRTFAMGSENGMGVVHANRNTF